jgi:isopenicillin N synthase-like dioxygenase
MDSFNLNDATNLERIAIVDVSRMYSENSKGKKAVTEEAHEAAKSTGFFYMIDVAVSIDSKT